MVKNRPKWSIMVKNVKKVKLVQKRFLKNKKQNQSKTDKKYFFFMSETVLSELSVLSGFYLYFLYSPYVLYFLYFLNFLYFL